MQADLTSCRHGAEQRKNPLPLKRERAFGVAMESVSGRRIDLAFSPSARLK